VHAQGELERLGIFGAMTRKEKGESRAEAEKEAAFGGGDIKEIISHAEGLKPPCKISASSQFKGRKSRKGKPEF